MPEADLYLDTVDLCRYWPANADMSCQDLLTRLAAGKGDIEDCAFLSPRQLKGLKLVLEAKTYLPPVPQLTVPQPIEKGLVPINGPGENSLVIVTANNRSTFEVLATIFAQDVTPAYFLLVDCLGSTVDMAMVYGDFTPARLAQVMAESALEGKVKHNHMIVPGFTASLAEDFAEATNWEVEVGPVCAAELPLFLGDRWLLSPGQK